MQTQLEVKSGRPRIENLSFAGARSAGTEPVASPSKRRLHAAILFLAPAVMATGLIYHPTIGNPTDPDFFARLGDAVRADSIRWAIAHHLVAIGSGLIALAFLALDGRLRSAGRTRAAAIGLPLVVAGSLLYALLPAMEFAPWAAAESGADPSAAQQAIFPWFVPTLFSGALLFAAGSVSFAIGIVRSDAFGSGMAKFIAALMVLAATCRLIPINLIHMDVQAVLGIAAMWPIAYLVWKNDPKNTQGGS